MDSEKRLKEELNKKAGKRLKETIKAKGLTQLEFADKVHFTQQHISNMCTGKKPIGHENVLRFSKLLDIRPEYLECVDDYMTENEKLMEKKNFFFRKIGDIAANSKKNIPDFNRLERISKLCEVGKQLEELYGVPVDWGDFPLASSLGLYSFIDEQLEHSFKTYFKYFNFSQNDTNTDWSSFVESLDVIKEDITNAIKQSFPKDTTVNQFFDLMKSPENRNKFSDSLRNKLDTETKLP